MSAADSFDSLYGGANTGVSSAALLYGAKVTNPYLLAASVAAPIVMQGAKSFFGPTKAERQAAELGKMNVKLGNQEIQMNDYALLQKQAEERDRREAEKKRKAFQGLFSKRLNAYSAIKGAM